MVSESVQADRQMIQDSFIGYKSAVIFIYGQSQFETRQIVISTSVSKIFFIWRELQENRCKIVDFEFSSRLSAAEIR